MKRLSIRARMTLLYSGLFFISGVLLLLFIYVGTRMRIGIRGVHDGTTGQEFPPPEGEFIPISPEESAQVMSIEGATVEQLLPLSSAALVSMTVLSLLLGYFITGRLLRPINEITATAQKLSSARLDQRIALQGPHDELRALAETFDAMLDRIQESFDSERRLTANMSHELRTPLTTQRAFLELAFEEDGATVEEKQRAGVLALDQNRRATGIIEGMLILAQASSSMEKGQEPVDLGVIVDRVCAEAAKQGDELAIGLEHSSDDNPFILAHPILSERLVHNLVNNGLMHNVPGGWVKVTLAVNESHLDLVVENSGPVLDEEAVAQLQNPFRRGDSDRTKSQEGYGLGLTIVQTIADFHDAELSIRPRGQGGLRVQVSFMTVADVE